MSKRDEFPTLKFKEQLKLSRSSSSESEKEAIYREYLNRVNEYLHRHNLPVSPSVIAEAKQKYIDDRIEAHKPSLSTAIWFSVILSGPLLCCPLYYFSGEPISTAQWVIFAASPLIISAIWIKYAYDKKYFNSRKNEIYEDLANSFDKLIKILQEKL